MPNIAKWKKLSKEEFAKLVAESHSYAELAEKIGYSKTGGGTHASLKRGIEEYNLDTSHFTGQAWNKGNYDYSSFDVGTYKKAGKSMIQPLAALRGHQCECCKNTEWNGQPIPLQVHHISGDRSDNRLENLQLLCPNCHAQTDNYCSSTKKIKPIVPEEDFVQALQENPNIHKALIQLGLTPAAANYTRARELIEKYHITHLYK